jgi:flagellar biosynthetic protein FlhB
MAHGGEKTEQPTDKRLREARRKGQVTKSQDLTSALLWLAALAALWLGGSSIVSGLAESMRETLSKAALFEGDLDAGVALAALADGLAAMAWALAPLLAVLFLMALATSFLQVGPVFSFEAVKMNAVRLNPSENFKQKFFKSRPYIELSKTILKLAVASIIVCTSLWGARFDLLRLSGEGVAQAASLTLSLGIGIGLKVGLVFLLAGAVDYFLQRFLYLKELRMTKQEVKQEFKESEGDPLIKGARRQLHLEILAQNMVAAVKGADVVVINPTHVAVALKYDTAVMDAPTVVAKGAGVIAAQIRRVAEESKVPIMRDVPLARTLFDLEVDAEVPEELYEAVAVVLRWVYNLARERGEV